MGLILFHVRNMKMMKCCNGSMGQLIKKNLLEICFLVGSLERFLKMRILLGHHIKYIPNLAFLFSIINPLFPAALSLITEVIKSNLQKRRNDTCTAMREWTGKVVAGRRERWRDLWSHYKVITKKKGQLAVTTAIKY